MTNVVEAGAATGARLVFIDNLYQLGPQDEPRREDMPLTALGNKPAILSDPDFYGPERRGAKRRLHGASICMNSPEGSFTGGPWGRTNSLRNE